MSGKQLLVSLAAALVVAALSLGSAIAQGAPPIIYSGTVTKGGVTAPDNAQIVAKIGSYTSVASTISGGRYYGLAVGPDASFAGMKVTFHLGLVQAEETDTFIVAVAPQFKSDFNLTFPPPPTPTPTATPLPTATPVTAFPSVYSGTIIVAGFITPDDAVLVARIRDYESIPALIQDGLYRNLVVDPGDISLFGERIEFFLNGVKSRSVDTYESGRSRKDFDLVFVGVPTPVPPTPTPTSSPTPTATAVPPTATPTPTPTPMPPTSTPRPTATATLPPTAAATLPPTAAATLPPTATATLPPIATATLPPTATATLPPTATATLPPTATPEPASPTPVPPTATPRASTISPPAGIPQLPGSVPEDVGGGGFCGSTYGNTTPLTGMGNLLALFGPLGLLVVRRSVRRR